jgi:hypothetical protein
MAVEWEFQKGLYAALTGNSALMAVAQAVYDTPPQSADGGASGAFPYITIGLAVTTEDDRGTKLGHSILARIHTWSRTGSMAECKQVQGLIYDALHNQTISVTGFSVYSVLRETSDTLRDADGVFHGVCEYRTLLEQS